MGLFSSQVAILDLLDVRICFGRGVNDITTNQVTTLAQALIGLAVFYPSAVLVVTPT